MASLNYMVNNLLKYILILEIACFCSCRNSKLNPDEFILNYPKISKSLTVKKSTEMMDYSVEILTSEILALHGENLYDNITLNRKLNTYDSSFYFKIVISPLNSSFLDIIGSKENYSEMNSYLMSDFKNDFVLKIVDRSFNCSLLHVESDILQSNKITVLLSFNKEDLNSSSNERLQLIYNDNLFRSGTITFDFDSEIFNDLPKLDLSF